ncbi:rhomboid family intramembrane serine protease [Agriterribacter sp.]|uniref:rhomboid family intramembrane serine protease n=1 Tax=Agriterribacter sp. TaxID=2821509 RepID=UPI002BFE2CCA|nr:rhomboid family intramembrane serine protease [Agriterribacter sp.]HRO47714.1 rhomboid family intramembrane serine protease [Agriterribacter sp.]HRQ18071.1 rhomboid family intramembrane serine protease [Agriterribacter sp.]
MSITFIILIVTCGISIMAFRNKKLLDDLIFYPPAISERQQYYRFFTCGFIHANFAHLAFNMYSFWIFGEYVEILFMTVFGPAGRWYYLLMYISALVVCLLPTYFKNKNNYHYRSLGASGAVSAVIFAFIFLNPLQGIGLVFLPREFMIPGFIFGFLYLVLSSYLDKKGGGNINHSAHIWGAVYGIAFPMITGPLFAGRNLLSRFLEAVQSYFVSF